MFNIWQYYRLIPLPTDEHHTAIDSDGNDGEDNKEKIIASTCIGQDGKGTGHGVFKILSSICREKQEIQGSPTHGRLLSR